MGIAICDKCERIIDLDKNLEDFNFKTCLCVECEQEKKQPEVDPNYER